MIREEAIKVKKTKLSYYFQGALEDTLFSKNIIISAIIIVMSGLCLFGAYIIICFNIDYISRQFQGQYEIIAYVEKGTPKERIDSMRKEIANIDYVNEIEFTSEEEAFNECVELFGDNSEFLDGLENENPLRGFFGVTLSELHAADGVSEKLGTIGDIVWVKNNQGFVTRIQSATSFMKNGSFIMMILFSIISVFIIANTIKISISGRYDDILAMRYLGATNDFIIYPFIIEGMLIGIAGAILALLIVLIGYGAFSLEIMKQLNGLFEIYPTHCILSRAILYLVLFGIVLGVSGSTFALRKHIKA